MTPEEALIQLILENESELFWEDCDCGCLSKKPKDKLSVDIIRIRIIIKIKESKTMNFSKALENIKIGNKVQREGWNGADMFIFLVPGSEFKVNRPPLLGIYSEGTEVKYLPHIDMRTADGTIVPWLASQTDLLAEDWMVVA